ncbi:MAG: hypothetical protein JF606_14700 [Burkholderiales bacterium]|nr:hypothetical protein [Burkholderiales bacterium]
MIALLIFLAPFAFCASVTHDSSVMLVPAVLLAPFVLLALLAHVISKKRAAREGENTKESADTVPDTAPLHRGLDARVRGLRDLHTNEPKDGDDNPP